MKKLFRRGTALLLSLAMALSLLCVSSFAADLAYAHLEVGKVTVIEEPTTGDTVKIPLSVVGLKAAQTCWGITATIALGDGLEWATTAVEWTGGDWNLKSLTTSNGNLYAIKTDANTGLSADGELCNLCCVVTEDYDGTNATVTVSNVAISDVKNASHFLNATGKGTAAEKDAGAVIFNGTKVGNTAVSPITISGGSGGEDPDPPLDPPLDPTPATYSIVAAATPASVSGGQDVTVTVTVKGGAYVAAAVKLTWDTDKLTLKTAPASGWDKNTAGTTYSYYNVNQNGQTFAEDTVIGTFIFTAKALTEAATAGIYLEDSYVEGSFNDDGTSTDPSTRVSNTDASVSITAATMTGWSITSKGTVQYTGSAQVSATVTTGTPADATVTYSWNGGANTSTTVPSFTEEGTYEVSYTISHTNYNDVTGSYTFKIERGSITADSDDVNVAYDGNPHSITVTVTRPEGTTTYYRTNAAADWSTTNPTFTDVTDGAQTVYWKVEKTGFTPVEGSNTVTITKATMTGVTVTAADAVTYDGTAHAAVKTATIPNGATIRYSSDNGSTWATVIPTFTNANTYPVKYKVTKANYNDVEGAVSFTINKCEVTIKPNSKHVSLGDALPTLDGGVQGDLVNDNDLGTITYSCPTFDNTKAGDYPITASYTENANYTVTVDDSAVVNVSSPDYVAEYVREYVAGYHMILVYTNSEATFSFDNTAMYDVSDAGYKYNNTTYDHVYAIVVKGAEGDTEETVLAKVKADMTAVAATLDYTKKLDVNSSGTMDLRDAVAVVAVYNVNETYMTSHMKIVLKADVDNSKNVEASDFNLIKAEYLK